MHPKTITAWRIWIAVLFVSLVPAAAPAQDLLAPEVAFKFSASAPDAATLEVRYKIADGYYLYRERFKFGVEPDTLTLGAARFPKGEIHNDEFFGKVETYRGDLRIALPLANPAGASRVKLTVTSQGCADVGVCYVPLTQTAWLTLPAASGAGERSGGVDTPVSAGPGASEIGEEARFQRLLASGSLWWITAAFFGAGILLTFTPCVLPMVPILSGIIVGEGRQATRARAFTLSFAYVMGMSLTYTAIGVAAALSGNLLSAALQNPWVLSGFALVFVVLALSMFGLYELQLPAVFRSRLHHAHSRLKGGQLGAVVVMGVLSAAIVSPCVAAPLAGALLYIGQTRDVWLGATALFALSLGMGVPLILVGVFEGAFLPKSGHWMNGVKHFFGVMLLAVAIWIIAPVLPVAVQMLAWAALLLGSAMALRAIDPLPADAGMPRRLGKALGFLALLAGAALAIGAFAGSRDVLRPLGGITGGEPARASATFVPVRNLAELEARLQDPGRPVMLDFYADWCVSCKELEAFTFTDAQVRARMEKMLLLRADVTANSADDKALLQRFKLFGPPGIVFFDSKGREIAGLRVIGFVSADLFVKTLDQAAGL